jgi:hypothetical protein
VDRAEITLPVESHARRAILFAGTIAAFSPSITRLPTVMTKNGRPVPAPARFRAFPRALLRLYLTRTREKHKIKIQICVAMSAAPSLQPQSLLPPSLPPPCLLPPLGRQFDFWLSFWRQFDFVAGFPAPKV